jgi:hypothetical protein
MPDNIGVFQGNLVALVENGDVSGVAAALDQFASRQDAESAILKVRPRPLQLYSYHLLNRAICPAMLSMHWQVRRKTHSLALIGSCQTDWQIKLHGSTHGATQLSVRGPQGRLCWLEPA